MTMIQNPIDILQTLKKKIPAEDDENWILQFDDESTRKKSASSQTKRNCQNVVCVARRNSFEDSCGDCQALKAEPDIVFTLDTKHHIVQFEIRASNLEFSEEGMVGKSVDQLCWKNDKAVLDTLLDSAAQCSSAQLILCIGEWTLTTQAKSKRSREPNETVTLECLIVRSRKQSIPKSAPIDSETPRWPRPSPASSSSSYSSPSTAHPLPPAPSHESLQSPSSRMSLDELSSTSSQKVFNSPLSAPPLTGSQLSYRVFQYSSGPPPSSNSFLPQTMPSQDALESPPQVEINPKTGKPKKPRKPRAPRAANSRKKSALEPATVIPDEVSMPPPYTIQRPPQMPTMKPPWETGLPYPGNGLASQRDTMLKSLLQSTPSSTPSMLEPPSSRVMKSPIPSDSTVTTTGSALWHASTTTPVMLPPPGSTAQSSSSMLANLLEPSKTPPALTQTKAVIGKTPTKGRRQPTNKEPRKRGPKRLAYGSC
ncbi:hypothetical protein L596_029942 [Steinernema carpocapsae]|uniref:Uncharacterized protein n=1 Tax=Steinernema carpocapsae TaxID=34508 RepID=A0A4U5LR95_STECR|nr:hypothetical protein L596_029942 [Steinernema carpocapsae]